jgi:hypothetical protein
LAKFTSLKAQNTLKTKKCDDFGEIFVYLIILRGLKLQNNVEKLIKFGFYGI